MAHRLLVSRRGLLAGASSLLAAQAGGQFITPSAYARQSAGAHYTGQIVISISGDIPAQARDALSAAYKAVQPDVELVWELPGASEDYATWLGTQLAAGDIRPDIVSGNYANSFRDYFDFNEARFVDNPYTGNTWNDDLDWDFFVSRDAAGHRNMLPTRGVHTMWYYNQDLFEQAGVQVPTTWTEFVGVCQALKDAGITPVATVYDWVVTWWLSTYYFDQYHVDWVETVRAKEGDWSYDPLLDGSFVFDPENPNIHRTYTYNAQRHWQAIRDGKLRFDTPSVAEVVKNLSDVFPGFANEDIFVATDYYPGFIQQQAAMMFDTTGGLTALTGDVPALESPFRWGYFNTPPMEGPLVKGPARCSESAVGEYISLIQKDQDQVDRCLDFLLFWLSAAGYKPYLDGAFASGEFAPSGPLRIKGVSDPGEFDVLFGGVDFTGSAAVAQNWFVYPGGGDSGPVNREAADLFADVLQKKIAPEEYADQLQDLYINNLDALLEFLGLTHDDLDNPARQPGT